MINSSFKQNVYFQYLPYAMAVLLTVGGVSLAWWGYSLYIETQEQAAFRNLAESIESFDKFIATGADKYAIAGGEDKLGDIERALEIGVQKYSNLKLVPFFYLYKADALIQKGDFNGALSTLDTAITKVEKSDPFSYLLLTKKALLKADSDMLAEAGLKELHELAIDKNNPFGPMAAYYLGLHYYHLGSVNGISQAKEIWQEALKRYSALKECSWCDLIRSKFNTIS